MGSGRGIAGGRGKLARRGREFNYGSIVLIGTGFGAVMFALSLYNAFVPIFLDRFVTSTAVIGMIMALDNVAGITLIPYFGAWSDRVRTRIGRRIPFVLSAMPIGAAAFALLTGHESIWLFVALDIVFTVAIAAVRAPAVALMPDLTPPAKRSTANGIINLLAGVGAALAFVTGGVLYDQDPVAPFRLGAGVMFVVPLLLLCFIREPAPDAESARSGGQNTSKRSDLITRPAPTTGLDPSTEPTPSSESKSPVAPASVRDRTFLKSLRTLMEPDERDGLRLLIALFVGFAGYASLESFFTLYATTAAGLTPGEAGGSLVYVSATFVICALPAGLAGAHFGRLTSIAWGMSLFGAASALLAFVAELAAVRVLLVAIGLSWALIVVNAYPAVVDRAPTGRIGAFTGIYYFFTSAGAIAAPVVVGALMDVLGRERLPFITAAILLAGAGLLPTKRPQRRGRQLRRPSQ